MKSKIRQLAIKIREDRKKVFSRKSSSLGEKYLESCSATRIIEGKRYIRIDVGPTHNWSGKLMINSISGEIFGIKGYGVVHKGKRYGNLDTIDDYFWGEYSPILKGD